MNSLPRDWMDPAKRPPENYLLSWQRDRLDSYDRSPLLVNMLDVFQDPVREPHAPQTFKTVFDFPPLPRAWKDPQRRPRRLRMWQKEVLARYDANPGDNMHLFNDWKGPRSHPLQPAGNRHQEIKNIGPSTQKPKEIFTNKGKLVGADDMFFSPPIEAPFKTLTKERLRKERERIINHQNNSNEVVPLRNQPEESKYRGSFRNVENYQKMKLRVHQNQIKKAYDSICSIESMISDIKQKLSLSK